MKHLSVPGVGPACSSWRRDGFGGESVFPLYLWGGYLGEKNSSQRWLMRGHKLKQDIFGCKEECHPSEDSPKWSKLPKELYIISVPWAFQMCLDKVLNNLI